LIEQTSQTIVVNIKVILLDTLLMALFLNTVVIAEVCGVTF